MSRTRVYKQATLDIQQRFFTFIQDLANEKRLPGGVAGYCETYGIDRRHFYAQKNNLHKGNFEIAWTLPLIKHFQVSAKWLLFGEGTKYEE
jgi:hypothetical protein